MSESFDRQVLTGAGAGGLGGWWELFFLKLAGLEMDGLRGSAGAGLGWKLGFATGN